MKAQSWKKVFKNWLISLKMTKLAEDGLYRRICRYVLYAILLIALFHMIRIASLLSIDGHHDGTIFNPASIVARGGILFRDTSTYYGPLMVYIQALFMRIFGINLSSMRLSAVVFYVFAFILYFQIFKRILPRYIVLISEVVLLFIAPFWMTTFHAWSSVYTLVTTFGVIYCSVRSIETGRPVFTAGAGACCIWTFLIRTPVGCIFILAALALWLAVALIDDNKRRYKHLLAFLGGFIAGLLPFLLLFAVQGTLGGWWNDCVVYTFSALKSTIGIQAKSTDAVANTLLTARALPIGTSAYLTFPQTIARFFRDLFPVNGSGVYIILPVAALILFFYELYNLIRTKLFRLDIVQWKDRLIFLIILWFSLASWHQYYGVSEVRHWFWGGFPMMGTLAYLIYYLCGQFRGRWRGAAAIILLLAVSATTIYERYAYYSVRKQKYVYEMDTQASPALEGIFLSTEQRQFYLDYCDVIRSLKETHPERYIRNDTFCILLSGLGLDDPEQLDKGKEPIIVSNSNNVEDYPGFFMAVELVQDYPEQELDGQRFKIRIWLPYDW